MTLDKTKVQTNPLLSVSLPDSLNPVVTDAHTHTHTHTHTHKLSMNVNPPPIPFQFPYLQADFDHLSDSSSEEEESDDLQPEEKEGGTERAQSTEVTTKHATSSTHPPAQLPPDLHPWVESGSSSPSSSEGEFDTGPDQWSDHGDNFI